MDTFLLLVSTLWRRFLCAVLGHRWMRTASIAKWKGWTSSHCARCQADRHELEGVRVVEWSIWR